VKSCHSPNNTRSTRKGYAADTNGIVPSVEIIEVSIIEERRVARNRAGKIKNWRVIPAKAGIQQKQKDREADKTCGPAAGVCAMGWIPAFAGMTAYVP
jgi:hypothetical protein